MGVSGSWLRKDTFTLVRSEHQSSVEESLDWQSWTGTAVAAPYTVAPRDVWSDFRAYGASMSFAGTVEGEGQKAVTP